MTPEEIAKGLTKWQRSVVLSLDGASEREFHELKMLVKTRMAGVDITDEDDRIDLHNEDEGLWDHGGTEGETLYWLTPLGLAVASALRGKE